MPSSAQELLELLDLETIDLNLFRGTQPDTMLQRVFGGQVAAQALVAGARTVEADRAVHSLHSYFLRPGDTTVPIVYDVERIRDGRSFSTRRIVARQHGRGIYYMTASFQVPEEGFEHQDVMPEVPSPGESQDLGEMFRRRSPDNGDEWTREWAALDLRFVGDSRPGGAIPNDERPSQSRLWIRVNGRIGDDPLMHRAAFTYASDMTLLGSTLVPHGMHVSHPKMQSASLDHTIWFHRPFRADEWLLYDQASPSASGARGLAFGRLFTESGVLVASVAQEGLIRYRG
ncbi:MAG TPA: acyl-CoA thioesterase II [Nocardioidaceae bacterium]|nr:acyl-CoA thioesterase II [Nocardioidaceae bacterium]